ncbi:flagellar biosynthesis regulator FlaF [Methylorubrum aminovorans]|uniref:flagellar biosynthesis regulator FlaF n=1 Tax=Methylorubrum aminovorans TaxID=269069 RepID=UPI000D59A6D6|nr:MULTISPECIES: flagellar biosynthesis regulator FlaF [unclassified Methylobacterium]AWI88512.1 flagellar biosynthesis regulatory protein FlaF [Methylobacterium sp. DM1]QIJ74446.1 flagellar biosynthesis regulator FlaF [Methylobacterium sp. CLZ]QIJ79352.1 flagellar biosynthesis regulator FlaF [Methylobacterium sp. NI91]
MQYAANAYAKVARVALSPREAEAAVLLKAAGRLQALGPKVEMGAALNEALTFNQRVWTILASAATEPSSPLPIEVRNGMAQLSTYVFHTIVDAMIEPTAEKIESLVSLNNHIAAGLQGDAGPGA